MTFSINHSLQAASILGLCATGGAFQSSQQQSLGAIDYRGAARMNRPIPSLHHPLGSHNKLTRLNSALVTGGTGGIGAAIVKQLVDAGHPVVINYSSDRSKEKADNFVDEINAGGGRAIAVKADISSPEEVKQMFAQAKAAFNEPVDVVVSNAGITKDKLAIRMSPNEFEQVNRVNSLGNFVVTQAAVSQKPKPDQLTVVSTSSVVGLIGNPGQANYAASKAAVIAQNDVFSKEFQARTGWNFFTVCPGYIESPMTKDLDLKAMGVTTRPPEDVAKLVSNLIENPEQQPSGSVHIVGEENVELVKAQFARKFPQF